MLCLSAVTCRCPVRLPDCRLPSACLSSTVLLALAVCLNPLIVLSGCLSAFPSPCSVCSDLSLLVLSDCQTAEYQRPVRLLLFSPWLSVPTFRLFGRAVCLPFRLLALSVCCDLSLSCPTARLKTIKCLSVFYCASRLGCLSQSSDCSIGLSVCLSFRRHALVCLSACRLPRLPVYLSSAVLLALAVSVLPLFGSLSVLLLEGLTVYLSASLFTLGLALSICSISQSSVLLHERLIAFPSLAVFFVELFLSTCLSSLSYCLRV